MLHATSLQQTPSSSIRSLHDDDFVGSLHATNPESTLQSIYPHITLVAKSTIAENGDYNLSGERYQVSTIIKNTKFDLIEIGELAELVNGRAFKPNDWEPKEKGGLPISRIQNLNNHTAEFNYYSGQVVEKLIIQPNDLLFSWSGSRGTSFGAHIWHGGEAILNQHIFKVKYDDAKILKKYFLYALNKSVEEVEQNLHGGVGLVHITKGNLERIKIPLPPLSIQQEIVTEIEAYQKVIDGARQVVENYKPRITIDPDWEMVELGEFIKIQTGGTPSKSNDKFWEGDIPWVSPKDMKSDFIGDAEDHVSIEAIRDSSTKIVESGSILIVVRSGILKHTMPVALTTKPVSFNQDIISIQPNNELIAGYLFYYLKSTSDLHIREGIKPGVTVQSFHNGYFKQIQIPLPPLEIQQQIVAQIEREQALVNANKELIALFEQKIKDRIARVWGE